MQDANNFNDIKLESRVYIGNLDLRSEDNRQELIPAFKVSTQEAIWAKEKMHGRMACGRPLVVRLASERDLIEGSSRSGEGSRSTPCGEQTSRSAKIAAIKKKLKAIDEESHKASKKQ